MRSYFFSTWGLFISEGWWWPWFKDRNLLMQPWIIFSCSTKFQGTHIFVFFVFSCLANNKKLLTSYFTASPSLAHRDTSLFQRRKQRRASECLYYNILFNSQDVFTLLNPLFNRSPSCVCDGAYKSCYYRTKNHVELHKHVGRVLTFEDLWCVFAEGYHLVCARITV